MENSEIKKTIIYSLRKIISNEMDEIEIYEFCKKISKWRFQSQIDSQDPVFDIFITIESELDSLPINLPSFAMEYSYLEKCKNEIRKYISENKNALYLSSKSILDRII